MKDNELLAHFLENLWSKGFKLSDEEVQFIYFGLGYTDSSIETVKLALLFTLQVQMSFDRSFYISLLELFNQHDVKNREKAIALLKKNHLY